MKLLVDANLSPRAAARLATAGYDTAHVSDHGLLAASDEAIAAFAVDNGMIIVRQTRTSPRCWLSPAR